MNAAELRARNRHDVTLKSGLSLTIELPDMLDCMIAVEMPMPVIKHEHRQWTETPPAERDRLSKRNFYRFLERWRDRWDLVLDPHPPEADTGRRS